MTQAGYCIALSLHLCKILQVLLNRVRANTGHWHELAKLLPVLAAAGYDSLIIEQEAGVERATQNRWTVSMQVPAHLTSTPHRTHQSHAVLRCQMIPDSSALCRYLTRLWTWCRLLLSTGQSYVL